MEVNADLQHRQHIQNGRLIVGSRLREKQLHLTSHLCGCDVRPHEAPPGFAQVCPPAARYAPGQPPGAPATRAGTQYIKALG